MFGSNFVALRLLRVGFNLHQEVVCTEIEFAKPLQEGREPDGVGFPKTDVSAAGSLGGSSLAHYQLVKIDQFSDAGLRHPFFAMKELGPKEALAVRCPTCGSAPGVRCLASTNLPRLSPHLAREIAALPATQS